MADVSELTITGTDGDDTLTLDLAADLAIPVTFDGGLGTDTLFGPVADTTWDVTGPDAGTVAGVDFVSVENLTGAADNQDTFVLATGGSVSGLVDGGDGGFDTLSVTGTTVVSNPERAELRLDHRRWPHNRVRGTRAGDDLRHERDLSTAPTWAGPPRPWTRTSSRSGRVPQARSRSWTVTHWT